MKTLKEVRRAISGEPSAWSIHLMDFVDDFRYYKDLSALTDPLEGPQDRWTALLASVAETLSREVGAEPPPWTASVPASKDPWFVSGMENLKAIALAESPLPFRIRKIFVTANFLSRA